MNGGLRDSDAGSEVEKSAPHGLPICPRPRSALAKAGARLTEPRPESPKEVNGQGGLDPARYGDWEVKGLASDF